MSQTESTSLTGLTTFSEVSTTPAGEVHIHPAGVRNMGVFLTPDKALTLAKALTKHALAAQHPEPLTEGTVEAIASRIDPDEARIAVALSIAEYGSRFYWDSDLNELIPMRLSGLIDIDDLPSWSDQDEDDVLFWESLL